MTATQPKPSFFLAFLAALSVLAISPLSTIVSDLQSNDHNISGLYGLLRFVPEWLTCCIATNTVQLAARIEQQKVGKPFWYRISSETV